MSRTYLLRTEARGTSSSIEPGLAARVADPLWLLGRQWQIGELIGEDAGTPVLAELAAEAATVSRVRTSHDPTEVTYDPAAKPLDVLTGDPVRSWRPWTARMCVDTGRAFIRLLTDAGVGSYADGYRQAYKLPPATDELRARDPSSARLLDIVSGRLPNGEDLYDALRPVVESGADLPSPPKIDPGDEDPVRRVAADWLAFCNHVPATTSLETWNADRLEHAFAVATSSGAGANILDAVALRGDAIDWHSFDTRPVSNPSDYTALPPIEALPAPVRFHGMPNARWWEFEDAVIDLGAVDAGPSDIARLALLEFALTYANDYFALPLRLKVGSLCRITSLLVTDTFGMTLRIVPTASAGRKGAPRWTMFTLTEREPGSAAAGVSDMLFLAPVAVQPITSRPIEEVLMLRDEMANLAWAVEQRYEGESGRTIEAMEEVARLAPEAEPPTRNAELRYLLETSVPPYWYPLVPEEGAGGVELVPRQMAGRSATAQPRGHLVSLAGPAVQDAEVPREGVRLLRDYAMARWTDGGSFVWARRLRKIGRGEGSSSLRFDAARSASDT